MLLKNYEKKSGKQLHSDNHKIKKKKYLGVNLAKVMECLHNVNFKGMKKELKEFTPNGKASFVLILAGLIMRNAQVHLITIQMQFFNKTEK